MAVRIRQTTNMNRLSVRPAPDCISSTEKTYLERQVAANRDFLERLLRAKDFQEAFRIQVEHFQSQLRTVAEDARQFGAQIAS